MRTLPFVLFACLAATSARAETWRVLSWDKFSLVAVDAEHRHMTGQKHPALPVLELTLHPTSDKVEARLSEEEVDCADQRVRQRRYQMFYNGKPLGVQDEIQVWRDPGEEKDRLLVRAACKPETLADAPAVTADQVYDAMAAHLAAARAPQTLQGQWETAWRAARVSSGPDAIPYVEQMSRQPLDFVVSTITEDGGIILLDRAVQKVAEQRYRFNAAYIGPNGEPKASAIWKWMEADCRIYGVRTLARVGFDARGHTAFAYDTNVLGVPFEPAQAGSVDVRMLHDVCAPAAQRNRKIAISADLQSAIAAYQFYFYGRGTRPVGGDTGWRQAYQQACDSGCLPKLH